MGSDKSLDQNTGDKQCPAAGLADSRQLEQHPGLVIRKGPELLIILKKSFHSATDIIPKGLNILGSGGRIADSVLLRSAMLEASFCAWPRFAEPATIAS